VETGNEQITVLVVDDEQDIREGSARVLTRMGFNITTASRGDEAMEVFTRGPSDIVLLDLKMPGADGLEVLAHIRSRSEATLVIVVTGYATVEAAIAAMKQGAYDFIPKPFEPDSLRIVVNRAAETIRLKRQAEKLAAERRRTLTDLDAEKSRIRTIIESLPDGVMVTNPDGVVVLINPSCRTLLRLEPACATGEPVSHYLPDPQLCELIRDVSKGRYLDFGDIPTHEFAVAEHQFLLARTQPVISELKECLGAVVNFADITAMKVIDRLKSEFVAKVSHELRSPLSTIHEQLAMALRDLGGEAGDRQLLARAKEKTYSLIAMIGDLLDLSRIEEGVLCREPRQVDLAEVLGAVVSFMRSQAEQKQQTLSLDLPQVPPPPMAADPVALESIFGNLIANAIKYTPAGGAVRVALIPMDLSVRVTVSDTGFGIEERHLEKIFERFYRIKDDNTRFITGTGLGLPIVKGLVDAMGGFIDVQSTPGQGSTFSVTLPIRRG
jgi:signal transduction histidine kinase